MNSKEGFASIIIVSVIALLGVGSGGYWYFGIHQPSLYAESSVMLYKDWRDGELQILDRVSIIAKEQGVYNYTAALETLKSLKDFIIQTQTELSDLRPIFLSGIEKQFHTTFSEFLRRNIETVHTAENRVKFLAKAKEYEDIFFKRNADAPIIRGEQSAPIALRMKTPEEAWREFEIEIPRAKAIGGTLFVEEVTGLNSYGPSYAQLKTAWGDTLPSFDVLVQTQGQDVNAARKIADFNNLITEVVRLNNIYSLLSRISAGDVPIFTGDGSQNHFSAPQELLSLAIKLNDDLWSLLQKYPELIVGHNVDQLTPSEYSPAPLEEQR